MVAKKKEIAVGTIRVQSKDLKAYEWNGSRWVKSRAVFPALEQVAKLFKSHRRFKDLVDTKQPRFLKGQLSSQGREQGARIAILPTGEKLEKAFSLFSPHLRIHDQDSHDHWDVLYQNKGGTWSYVYTVEKRRAHRARKYKKVEEFAKHHQKLLKNVTQSLKTSGDVVSVAMYTLLMTYMRVGNETYYKAHGHKGLTTLTKKNVTVDGQRVLFDYIGKDGVPISISQRFPKLYVDQLQSVLKGKKRGEFVFAKNGHPLHERDFKKAFIEFCGKEFYPHIVRSHHATSKVKQFLKGKRKTTKEEVQQLYLAIAHDLGHKKFNKKTQQWEDHYAVTVNSYVQPELVEKVEKLIKK